MSKRQFTTSFISLVIVFFFNFPVHAGDWFSPLSKADVALVAADTLLLGADWSQTRYIAAHPDTFHETNGIIGGHPTTGRVNAYFGAVIPLYWLTAYALPSKEDHGYKRFINREYFSITIGAMEGITVGKNASIRIGMKF